MVFSKITSPYFGSFFQKTLLMVIHWLNCHHPARWKIVDIFCKFDFCAFGVISFVDVLSKHFVRRLFVFRVHTIRVMMFRVSTFLVLKFSCVDILCMVMYSARPLLSFLYVHCTMYSTLVQLTSTTIYVLLGCIRPHPDCMYTNWGDPWIETPLYIHM